MLHVLKMTNCNIHTVENTTTGFLGGSVGKESTCNARDVGLIPGLGRPPGGGHGNPLKYSCLENPYDQRSWRAAIHGVAKSQT